ncbi:MAG: GIY-YIG nuclease family protein [Calditrichaeota bacterium]|nr:GIY-YIG nuclease family protein [Calditrichota bacterium]
MDKTYYTYIMASISRRLYVGVTNNLHRRVSEHKRGEGCVFTARYKIDKLVYYETFKIVANAIAREKTIKGWLRERKLQLIEEQNLGWLDLSDGWFRDDELGSGK